MAMTTDSQPSHGGPTIAAAPEPTHAAPLRVTVLNNYTDAVQSGIPICLGNPSRPESIPGGIVTQTVTVPDGVAAVDSATVQIDPNSGATATATLSGSGGSVTTSATPSGDTSFAFPRLSVSAGSSLTLTIRFSSQQSSGPGGTPRGVKMGAGCPPSPVRSLGLDPVQQSGAGALT